MLMLIPLALITGLVVILLVMAQDDDVAVRLNEIAASSRAISFHHEVVLGQPLAPGFLTDPGGGVFTAFEGLESFTHFEGGTIFVLTWPRRFTDPLASPAHAADAAERFSEELIRNAMQRAGRSLSDLPNLPGMTVQGDLESQSGAFALSVGPVFLPFNPPIDTGTPVILTLLSAS